MRTSSRQSSLSITAVFIDLSYSEPDALGFLSLDDRAHLSDHREHTLRLLCRDKQGNFGWRFAFPPFGVGARQPTETRFVGEEKENTVKLIGRSAALLSLFAASACEVSVNERNGSAGEVAREIWTVG